MNPDKALDLALDHFRDRFPDKSIEWRRDLAGRTVDIYAPDVSVRYDYSSGRILISGIPPRSRRVNRALRKRGPTMKLRVTLEFDSPEDAAAFLTSREHDEHDAPVAGETPEQATERKKRVRRTKAQIAADEAAAAAAAGQPGPIATAPAATPAPAPAAAPAPTAAPAPAPQAANVVDFMGAAAAPAAKPAITPEERLRRLVAEVRPAIQVVVDKKGPDVARGVVQHFGVGNLDQIPAERYDEFIAQCRAAAA